MKVLIIIPYFGKLPNYFPLWLKTAKFNSSFNWLLFLDDKTPYEYPSNVFCEYTDFTFMKNIISSKFDFSINLDSPYKLCDFRPSYGFIFKNYIKDYDFWGYGDLDLLYGNLSKFITKDILTKYDRVLPNGHLSLYRNNSMMNEAFMLQENGFPYYKDVFSSPKSFAFDEWAGMTSILKKNRRVQNLKNTMADFSWLSFKFKHSKKDHKNYIKELFLWNSGGVFQLYESESGDIESKEFSYIHLQKRNMKLLHSIEDYNDAKKIVITPNSFEIISPQVEININLIKKYSLVNRFDEFRFNINVVRRRYYNLLRKLNLK